MKKSKAIIFDIDGTAIDTPDRKHPSERLTQAIKRLESEYYICAATGRAWSHAKPALVELELTDACIIAAGTQICNPQSGEIIWQQSVDPRQLPTILAIMKESGYNVLADDVTEEDYLSGAWSFAKIANKKEAYMLEISFVPQSKAPALAKKFEEVPNTHASLVVAQRPGFNDIHITHNLANKEHAIAELCEMLQVDRTETIGIGDGHNDIALFSAVGHKVAMGNAVIELKEHADIVIGSIKEDGLAQYFEELTKNDIS